jgi:predicted GNAT family N-acyltransferase
MTEVRPARDADELRAAFALRHEVFVVEQGVPVAEEVDDLDAGALHLVAVDDDGRVVATCRLVADGDIAKLGRLAVAPAARGRGLASRLIAESEARAVQFGARRIALAAQTGALGLYERLGYTPYGERFMDAGIEHQMMAKRLGESPAAEPPDFRA